MRLLSFLLVATSVVALGAPCTKGTDCFADCLAGPDQGNGYRNAACRTSGYPVWTQSVLVHVEDYDDPRLDDGTGVFWDNTSNFISGGGFNCPAGPSPGIADEGTDPEDCYNFVQNTTCDVAGETRCAVGNQSLGHKFDQGYVHGIFGRATFPPTSATFGVTLLMKWSPNLVSSASVNGQMAFKHNQWGSVNHTFLGQNRYTGDGYGLKDGMPNRCQQTSPTPTTWLDEANDDMLWGRSLGINVANRPDLRSSAGTRCPIGRIYAAEGEPRINFAPTNASFPGGAMAWTPGTWACIQMQFTNFGSNNASIEAWFQKETQATATKVMEFTNVDLSDIERGETSLTNVLRQLLERLAGWSQ